MTEFSQAAVSRERAPASQARQLTNFRKLSSLF
jgi:hypothetical protein